MFKKIKSFLSEVEDSHLLTQKLEEAKSFLKETPCRIEGEYQLSDFQDFIDACEPELAYGCLEYIAKAHEEFGNKLPKAFWAIMAEAKGILDKYEN